MKKMRRLWMGMALLAVLSGCVPVPIPTETPAPDPYSNEYAQVDVSRLEDGVVSVRYTGGADVRIKAQITREEGEKYNYNLLNDGSWESFTLTEGNGEYTLRVLENVTESKYKPVFECPLTLELEDPATPFRQACQQVPFTENTAAVLLAHQLIGGLETEEEKVRAVLEYVTEQVAYDKEKAGAVEAGTLTENRIDVDAILSRGKGICGDYAAVVAVMLRSQGVACKVVHGKVEQTPGEWVTHAWVEVPGKDGDWERMDPTFLANASDKEQIEGFIGNEENYQAKYYY